MSGTRNLASRIDDEFAAVENKIKAMQCELVREYRERRERLGRLGGVFEKLAEAWKPRLQTLLQKFGDRVQVTPQLTPSSREAVFEFPSDRGHIRLRFSASTDRDIRRVILSYDLEIRPVFFRYEPHAEMEFPIDAVDEGAAARWVDDRIVEFVRAYLSMGENEFYSQGHVVEDPVARVSFPDYAAGATLEWRGERRYFIGEETRQEFARQNEIPLPKDEG